MQYVCDAPPNTWFRIESDSEAALESRDMNHAVEKYYMQSAEQAAKSFVPPKGSRVIEQSIGRKGHIQRTIPLFVTLRDREGKALVTAMLPPGGKDDRAFRPIVVGPANADPFPAHGEEIRILGEHYGIKLDPAKCYPYRRG